MDNIRAFVGHSFSEQDKPLVRKFLDHFDTLAKGFSGFSWDHAEAAEAGSISEKVLRKIDGKNVFIGICTRHERAVRKEKLTRSFWNSKTLLVAGGDLEWKASDWIIQEIGLAVGRRMTIILFMEEGVRKAGGLFSDVEYVAFDRDRPHESFDKFFEMLTSLKPKDAVGSSVEGKASPEDEKSKIKEEGTDDLEPREDWSVLQFKNAVMRSMIFDKTENVEKLTTAFKASFHGEGIGRAEWDGYLEWAKLWLGRAGDFEKLRRLAEENPTSSELQSYVGRALLEFKEFPKAAGAFERAAEHTSDPVVQVSHEGDAARAYARAGNLPRALELFEKTKAVAKRNPELTRTVAVDLRMFAESEKDSAFEISVMEHMMALKPADSALRFDLAFKHSEFSNEDMAFDHYLKIPVFSRGAHVWNNLGVSYGNFHLPIKSVAAFKQAESKDNTLAMANLGWRFINAGFINEARELTEKAIKIENYHENITDLVKRVKQAPNDEDKKESDAIEKVQPKTAFYRHMGGAVFDPFFELIDGKWHGPDCVLEANRTGRHVVFTGAFEVSANSLAFALNPLIGTAKVTRRVTFSMKMNGGMLAGEVKRKNDGESSPTLAGLGMDGVRVLMYVDAGEHRSTIKVMEGGGGDTNPRFYELTRMSMVTSAPPQ